ncbi:glycosyltransferase [Hymenobacter sp. BT683]|uniref:Glycosyltransferase n=1 Tax=Hymenobacter jeongseonensis TaxID=2791027 RepID=A0ABS0ICQ7_9BACT|nr:glycosyltransferase [Hymenobacter jeongseonensis]MBF9235834.1 glycosyltransferase [Hymenobacter jeongseonensis]
MTSFDLVLPCYNPIPGWATNLLASVTRLREALPEAEPHIILVNDGSAQGVSAANIEELRRALPQFTYVDYALNQGKGHALRTGVQHCKHPLCLFTDIDFPYEETSMAQLFRVLAAGQTDVAAGIRDSNYYSHVPPARVAISRTLRFLTKQLLHLPVSDTQCGLKGFNDAGKALFLSSQTKRYLFDLEFLYMSARQPGLRVQPVEVRLKEGVVFSKMPLGVLSSEGYSLLKILLRG